MHGCLVLVCALNYFELSLVVVQTLELPRCHVTVEEFFEM